MNITFTKNGWEDYQHWIAADRKIFAKINRLIGEITRNPFEGIGKPEPLRADRSGYWSRRISDEHRLVYSVAGETITIVQARYHY
ncbi:Txe/YoeB family addiction module toxin [Nocardia tengchongensis]|uniref:Txe/YoeB family addiction module toxin n=1 Tax=Nocardia tengchongensis TaxID=2055889 RepID=UPI00367AA299